MLATLVLSLLLSAATTSAEGSFQGTTVEITDRGGCTGCGGDFLAVWSAVRQSSAED